MSPREEQCLRGAHKNELYLFGLGKGGSEYGNSEPP